MSALPPKADIAELREPRLTQHRALKERPIDNGVAAGHYDGCWGMEDLMVFEHPAVNRSWVTYEIGKDRSMATILHVEPNKPIPLGGKVESELADAIVEFMRRQGDEIDRAEVLPPNH
jgi:hypothetical protein